jgi:flavin reductase (DIM6/NTAB) family NADH-FMN oxidoreductase RutF
LGSHTLFLAEVLAVQVDAALVDAKGRLRLEKAGLLAFAHGEYFTLGRSLGRFGFSVRKRRRNA